MFKVLLLLSLLHTSDVSTIARARTFTLEHKRRKQGGSYLTLTIALTFCRFTLEDFWQAQSQDKHKKNKIFLFLALAITLFSLHTRFFCVAIALALTSLVWSSLHTRTQATQARWFISYDCAYFLSLTVDVSWHKRNRKRKTSTRKTKFSFFLRLRLRFFSLHTRFFRLCCDCAYVASVKQALDHRLVAAIYSIYFLVADWSESRKLGGKTVCWMNQSDLRKL